MIMSQQPCARLPLKAFQETGLSEALCLHQVPQQENPFMEPLRSELQPDDSIADFDQLLEMPNYYNPSDLKQFCTIGKFCSRAEDIKDYIPLQNSNPEACFAISSYKVGALETVTKAVSNEVSLSTPPNQDLEVSDADTFRRMMPDSDSNHLQFSSSDKACVEPSGAGRCSLLDASPITEGRAKEAVNSHAPAVLHDLALGGTSGGIKKTKKRSRASKRPPTTVLEADSANFRSMVQQLTGLPSSPYFSNFFPRRGPESSSHEVRSQLHPSLMIAPGGQSLPGLFSDIPSFQPFRQPLTSMPNLETSVYEHHLPRTDSPVFRYLFGEGDRGVPSGLKPSTGQPSSTLKDIFENRSCSMDQNMTYQYPGTIRNFPCIVSSQLPDHLASPDQSCRSTTPVSTEANGRGELKDLYFGNVSGTVFNSRV